ncbi:MAG: hypothetical protein CL768_06935 [Chloroflexi bacterium]|nr:hypothetical protein [Chloroflexota bacterium]|tara:strand:- start:2973 stop:3269 length:297 start_codon:yes stop_codon:yes gene_type:complete
MAHDIEEHHPATSTYLKIFVILSVMTLIEFGVFYLDLNSALMTWIIFALSLIKFVLVVGFYMHLKMDDWRFRVLFVAPFIIMILIMIVLLALFSNLTR